MGTVIEFNDGQDRKVLVLDAQYRFSGVMGGATPSALTPYNDPNTNGTWYIHGGSAKTTPTACASLTDAELNALWANDANTSRQNTDIWLTVSACTASVTCRAITVNGVGCDIPNIQTLMRIYCEGVNLDALDPTVSEYSTFGLASWSIYRVLSSTTYTGTQTALTNRSIQNDGDASAIARNVARNIIPVLELS